MVIVSTLIESEKTGEALSHELPTLSANVPASCSAPEHTADSLPSRYLVQTCQLEDSLASERCSATTSTQNSSLSSYTVSLTSSLSSSTSTAMASNSVQQLLASPRPISFASSSAFLSPAPSPCASVNDFTLPIPLSFSPQLFPYSFSPPTTPLLPMTHGQSSSSSFPAFPPPSPSSVTSLSYPQCTTTCTSILQSSSLSASLIPSRASSTTPSLPMSPLPCSQILLHSTKLPVFTSQDPQTSQNCTSGSVASFSSLPYANDFTLRIQNHSSEKQGQPKESPTPNTNHSSGTSFSSTCTSATSQDFLSSSFTGYLSGESHFSDQQSQSIQSISSGFCGSTTEYAVPIAKMENIPVDGTSFSGTYSNHPGHTRGQESQVIATDSNPQHFVNAEQETPNSKLPSLSLGNFCVATTDISQLQRAKTSISPTNVSVILPNPSTIRSNSSILSAATDFYRSICPPITPCFPTISVHQSAPPLIHLSKPESTISQNTRMDRQSPATSQVHNGGEGQILPAGNISESPVGKETTNGTVTHPSPRNTVLPPPQLFSFGLCNHPQYVTTAAAFSQPILQIKKDLSEMTLESTVASSSNNSKIDVKICNNKQQGSSFPPILNNTPSSRPLTKYRQHSDSSLSFASFPSSVSCSALTCSPLSTFSTCTTATPSTYTLASASSYSPSSNESVFHGALRSANELEEIQHEAEILCRNEVDKLVSVKNIANLKVSVVGGVRNGSPISGSSNQLMEEGTESAGEKDIIYAGLHTISWLQKQRFSNIEDNGSTTSNDEEDSGQLAVEEEEEKERRSKLPLKAVCQLRTYFLNHLDHPYPTEEEKSQLATATSLSVKQITNWFTNTRRRFWQPYLKARKLAEESMPSSPQGEELEKVATPKKKKLR